MVKILVKVIAIILLVAVGIVTATAYYSTIQSYNNTTALAAEDSTPATYADGLLPTEPAWKQFGQAHVLLLQKHKLTHPAHPAHPVQSRSLQAPIPKFTFAPFATPTPTPRPIPKFTFAPFATPTPIPIFTVVPPVVTFTPTPRSEPTATPLPTHGHRGR